MNWDDFNHKITLLVSICGGIAVILSGLWRFILIDQASIENQKDIASLQDITSHIQETNNIQNEKLSSIETELSYQKMIFRDILSKNKK